MEAFKEKQFLVFKFEDGKNVKYNLATGETIGKSGKPVKDICTQLRGYKILDVINSFPDENYRNFLTFIDSRVNHSTHMRGRVDKIRNLGTFLSQIRRYSNFEQFYACGLTNIDIRVNCELKDIPKGLIKICKENKFCLNNSIIECYKNNPNVFNNLLSLELNSLSKSDILQILLQQYSRSYYNLVDNYNYKPQSLITYVDNLMTYEAIENKFTILNELKDYAYMMERISPKYEKYPKNFLTTHRIACRNYNRLKEQFIEEDFNKRVDKSLEYTYENYKFIYPNNTQEIKDEAVQQNNCVASYIQRVIDGKCHILFLRKKDSVDESLITLEIRDGKVVQAKGRFNRDVTPKEQLVINKYNKRLEKMKQAS